MTQPRVKYNSTKLQIQIFMLLSVLYYILNIIFPTDYTKEAAENVYRIYPQIAAGVLAAYSLLIATLSIRKIWHNPMMRSFLLLLILAVLYIFYPLKPVQNTTYVLRVYMAIITMLAEYALLRKVKDAAFWDKNIYWIYFFQVIFCFTSLVGDRIAFLSSTERGFDSNAGFMLVTCIPLALTLPKKRLRAYVYALLLLGCLYCGQRSAALAALISFPLCLWYLKGNIRKTDVAIFLILGLIIIFPVLNEALTNLQLRNEIDLERGTTGSGRSIFWLIVLQDFFTHDIFHIILGNGTNSVAELLDRTYGLAIGAHNGWLDILYTFGLIGLLLYGKIIFSFIGRDKKTSAALPEYRHMYWILFLIFFVKASTSHGYFDISVVPFLTAIAMMEGRKDRHNLQAKHDETTGNPQ